MFYTLQACFFWQTLFEWIYFMSTWNVSDHLTETQMEGLRCTLGTGFTRKVVPSLNINKRPMGLNAQSPIALSFALRTTILELQAILTQVHRMSQNDLEQSEVKGTPYAYYNYPPSLKFIQFSSTSVKLIYRPLWEKCTEWPQMTLSAKRPNAPYIHVESTSRVPKFTKFHKFRSMPTRFLSYRLFWDEMALNTKRSKVPPYTCYCSH